MTRPSNPELSQAPWATLPCVCANVRRLARLATRLYDEALRPAGMESGQFSLLATIRHVPGISQTHIARRLGMDTTSLTRTLGVLLKHGWIEKAHASDRRSRVFRTTRQGKAQLLRARPHWQRAQERLASLVGADGIEALVQAVEQAALALNTEIVNAPRARQPARTQKGRARAPHRR